MLSTTDHASPFAGRYVVRLPDLARGGRVKCGDNPVGASLPDI